MYQTKTSIITYCCLCSKRPVAIVAFIFITIYLGQWSFDFTFGSTSAVLFVKKFFGASEKGFEFLQFPIDEEERQKCLKRLFHDQKSPIIRSLITDNIGVWN